MELAAAFLGALLIIITGLMAFLAKMFIGISNKLVAFGTKLDRVITDLDGVSKHTSAIAVLESQMANAKSEINLLFEKLRDIEIRKIAK